MKKIAFIIILALLLKPVMPVVDYVVNYEYVSKVLCVNKAKPQMHCNGKCHLMKELAKAAESEKPASSDKKSIAKHFLEELFCQDIISLPIDIIAIDAKNATHQYSNLYCFKHFHSVFHPPTLTA